MLLLRFSGPTLPPWTMPPPEIPPLLPEMVLLLTVSVPLSLKTPPPSLPDMVPLLTVSVPPLLKTPPPSKAELVEKVLLLTVSVTPPSLWNPAPEASGVIIG